MNDIQTSPVKNGKGIPGPLRVKPNMRASWHNFNDVDYETAVEHMVRAHALDGAAVDLPVLALQAYGLVPVDDHMALAPVANTRRPMPLRATAFSNLMTRLGAPADFVRDKLPAPLQLATCNWLMQAQNKSASATLRLRGNDVAAIVSERYAPLDAEPLCEVVHDVLQAQGLLDEVQVTAVASGVVDLVRLVFHEKTAAVKVGDVSALGIDISSSSFGMSAVHVRGLIWRLRCTNGLRVAENMGSASFRHVGDVDRLKLGIAEAIPNALAVADGTLGRWKAAVNAMVENVEQMIADLRDLSVSERETVTFEVKREAGTTELPEHLDLYSVINGITAAAHQVGPARRLEMEAMAGEILQARTS